MKSEKLIAFDNNNVASFRNEMGYFQAMPLKQLQKVQVRDRQMGEGGPQGSQPFCGCYDCLFVNFVFIFFFFFPYC